MTLYNEIEPFASRWLGNLVTKGHIADGVIDPRSIVEVQASDLIGHIQCHFFAGIGVWSYALRTAGWPDDTPVWTGSCPCQPFSNAGKHHGFDDERHLWPEWFRLIRECRPPIIFGEQVASPAALAWFDTVSADLENEGYAVGAANLCAAGVGAPHIRQRLYFVAVADQERRDGIDAYVSGRGSRQVGSEIAGGGAALCGRGDSEQVAGMGGQGTIAGMDNAEAFGFVRGWSGQEDAGKVKLGGPGLLGGFWSDADWIPCLDGKARPVEPGTFPLAHGAPARVGRLRGYGNAIVAPLAVEFIRSVMDVLGIAE